MRRFFSANFAPFCNCSFVILSVIKLLITHFHCGIYPAFRYTCKTYLQRSGVVNKCIIFLGGYLFERFDMFD